MDLDLSNYLIRGLVVVVVWHFSMFGWRRQQLNEILLPFAGSSLGLRVGHPKAMFLLFIFDQLVVVVAVRLLK